MVYVPILRELFRVATLHPNDVVVVAMATLGAFVWMEVTARAGQNEHGDRTRRRRRRP